MVCTIWSSWVRMYAVVASAVMVIMLGISRLFTGFPVRFYASMWLVICVVDVNS